MALSTENKKLRRWFRNNNWKTDVTHTGIGLYLESPTQEINHFVSSELYENDKRKEWKRESFITVEIDRFDPSIINFKIYERDKNVKIPEGAIPSNESWGIGKKGNPNGVFSLSLKELNKITELVNLCEEEYKNK